ncbi:MAG: alpha-D-ribose 1-methylphosphonate 5-triphosphate diphosphatase [Roseinatronobacter sp.]
MSFLPPLRLTGAQVLHESGLQDADLFLSDGMIVETTPAHDIDLRGYLVLPGIIDLHGDGFEHHLSPRPSAPFDKRRALLSAASELAVNGITTAWLAQSWSWEGGFRSGVATQELLAALDKARSEIALDMRVQIRLETHILPEHDAVRAAVALYGVDYVVFNDHLPEAVELAEQRPERFAQWAAQQGRDGDALMALVRKAQEQDPQVPDALRALAQDFAALGVRMGSHDDATPETRAFFRDIGAAVCEFPTTVAAAQSAREAGDPIVMGAPNVVRGGSQSGNIAATDLIAAGLCDGLVSDYYYPALKQSVWALVDRGLVDFATAWRMISTGAADIAGLPDRGRLEPGQRADIVVLNPGTRRVEMTLAAGRVAHLSGEIARRVIGIAAT